MGYKSVHKSQIAEIKFATEKFHMAAGYGTLLPQHPSSRPPEDNDHPPIHNFIQDPQIKYISILLLTCFAEGQD